MASDNQTEQRENDCRDDMSDEVFESDELFDDDDKPDDDWLFTAPHEWEAFDPQTAPHLSSSAMNSVSRSDSLNAATGAATGQSHPATEDKANGAAPAESSSDAGKKLAQLWFDSPTLAALPFHHLIPLENLASAYSVLLGSLRRPETGGAVEHRRRTFQRAMTEAGMAAAEAKLLDEAADCRFTDTDEGVRVEIDWKVLFYDDFQGCAELYRAELLVLKRRIYEAGEDLRVALELRADEFLPHLTANLNSASSAAVGVNDLQRWFTNNLTGAFVLTVSELKDGGNGGGDGDDNEDHRENKQRQPTPPYAGDSVNRRTYGGRRIQGTLTAGIESTVAPATTAVSGTANNKRGANADLDFNSVPVQTPGFASPTVYRLRLDEYWLDWQQSARAARFDFDWLATLTDVRAMRFYELTKLWRLRAVADTAAADTAAAVTLPNVLEMEYDQFAALLPLPRLRSVRKVEDQIREITEPLHAAGYVKSFAVEADRQGTNRPGRIIFKFRDDFSGK